MDRNCAVCLCLVATTCRALPGYLTMPALQPSCWAQPLFLRPRPQCYRTQDAVLLPPCHVTERDHSIAPRAAALLRHQNAATLPYQWNYYSRVHSTYPINTVTITTKLLENCLTVCNWVTYSLFWGNWAKNASILLCGCLKLLAPQSKIHAFLPMHQPIIGGVFSRDFQALSTSTISISPSMFVTRS